ncbi:hypothetical protein V8C37DRAFT_415223 [Trichoderma ceciliae]
MKTSVVLAMVSTMMASASALVTPTRNFNVTNANVTFNASIAAREGSGVPICAVSCLENAIRKMTDCKVSDYACACKYQGRITGAATGCVVGSCGLQNAVKNVVPAVRRLCEEEAKKEKEKGEKEENVEDEDGGEDDDE